MPKAKKKPAVIQPVVPTPPPAPEPQPVAVVATPNQPARKVVYPTLEIVEYSTAARPGPFTIDRVLELVSATRPNIASPSSEYCYSLSEIKKALSAVKPRGPMTPANAKIIMGWETESEYLKRKLAENPGSKPEQWMEDPRTKQVFGDVFHCRNTAGEKVRCHNNANNRAFDQWWCEDLVHTILSGQWAGPHTVPADGDGLPGTVNCETVRVSRYGRVISGQHTLSAVILANEWLHKTRKEIGLDAANAKWPTWANHNDCFIEVVVSRGMSEDPRILMTVDYNKPRSVADVFYTTNTFRDASPPARKELCKLLAVACDFLWTRTAARGYKTHPETVAFLERHKSLLKCVMHVYRENAVREASADGGKGRKLGLLRLNPGQCAAMMYLMAASGPKVDDDDTYGNTYRNAEPAPSEKQLDFSLWQKAEDFWVELAGSIAFRPVRKALARLIESSVSDEANVGLGGRLPEKLALLANAWAVYKQTPPSVANPFSDSDMEDGGCLSLNYTDRGPPKILNGQTVPGDLLPDGQVRLIDLADFGGIDCPEVVAAPKAGTAPPDPEIVPTPEEIAAATQAAQQRRAAAAAK